MALLAQSGVRWRLWQVVVGLIAVLLPPADGAPAEEHQVKAAFLYNFAKFVAWPEPPAFAERRRFVFGLLGTDGTAEALPDLARNKTMHGYPIEVRRGRALADIGACDVLYLAGQNGGHLDAVLQQLGTAPVLTVSDVAGFAGRGGMIELYLEAGRVRFAVNVNAMRAAGLELSSKLLALARIVGRNPEAAP